MIQLSTPHCTSQNIISTSLSIGTETLFTLDEKKLKISKLRKKCFLFAGVV